MHVERSILRRLIVSLSLPNIEVIGQVAKEASVLVRAQELLRRVLIEKTLR